MPKRFFISSAHRRPRRARISSICSWDSSRLGIMVVSRHMPHASPSLWMGNNGKCLSLLCTSYAGAMQVLVFALHQLCRRYAGAKQAQSSCEASAKYARGGCCVEMGRRLPAAAATLGPPGWLTRGRGAQKPLAVSSRFVGQARAASRRSPSLAGGRQQTPCGFQVHRPSPETRQVRSKCEVGARRVLCRDGKAIACVCRDSGPARLTDKSRGAQKPHAVSSRFTGQARAFPSAFAQPGERPATDPARPFPGPRLGDQARVAPRRPPSVSAWRAASETPRGLFPVPRLGDQSRFVAVCIGLASSRRHAPCGLF